MLFDLHGKRRRVIQVAYTILAALFLIGFVGFGVGSETGGGGILDAFTGGNGGGNPQYEQDVEDAEQRLAENPKDKRALLQLAEAHYLSGQSELEADEETGEPVVTDEARTQFDLSIAAWERYLELEKKQPRANIATLVVQAYVLLNNARGAAETQEIIAEARPSQGAYANLAYYLYFAGDIKAGDEAAERAVAEANDPDKGSLREQLNQVAKLAERQQRQLEKQAEAAPEGQNPLDGGLGGLSGGAGGAAPVAP